MSSGRVFEARSLRRLLVSLFVAGLALVAGGWLTGQGMNDWYRELQKPPWQPPGWVFGVVWPVLYALMALAAWKCSVSDEKRSRVRRALGLYAIQLLLNVAWSAFFFWGQNPRAALVEILILDLFVLGTTLAFFKISRLAGWLMVPYVLWLGLAIAINTWIVLHLDS